MHLGPLTELLENPQLLSNLVSVGQDFVLGGEIPSVGEVGGILDGFGGWGWGSDSGSDPTSETAAEICANPDNATWQKAVATGPSSEAIFLDNLEQYKPDCNDDLLHCPVLTADDCLDQECIKQKCIDLVKKERPDANGASVATPYDYLSVLCLA